ncbi:MAG: tyrosine--tRNA ligase [Pseudomonadota bacterium]|nr:tyrosine--tRNA ligase [Pseudomonadota bacterium]
MKLGEELQWRGLVKDKTCPTLLPKLSEQKFTLYCGFDPTASSLHIGSLLPLLLLRRLQRQGHQVIAVLGGATGMIGDPSGKDEERLLLTKETIAHNCQALRTYIAKFLHDERNPPRIVDNYEWFADINYISFLRDVGKHFSVNAMIAKESVRMRLETREQGISYTEFSYALMQSYDFYQLYQRYGCNLQIGGSDQWGNITSGVELIRKLINAASTDTASDTTANVYGLTFPLLTKSDGRKFGKTATGNVWLTADRTSPYDFYQFFLRTSDADALLLLRQLTDISRAELEAVATAMTSQPELRQAQQQLATAMLKLVHGEGELAKVTAMTAAFFAKDKLADLTAEQLQTRFADTPCTNIDLAPLSAGVGIAELLTMCGLCASRGQAKRDISAGGVYINATRVSDVGLQVDASFLLAGQFIVLRKGKKTFHLLRIKQPAAT